MGREGNHVVERSYFHSDLVPRLSRFGLALPFVCLTSRISIDLNLAGMGSHHCACMMIRDWQKQLVYYWRSNDHARSDLGSRWYLFCGCYKYRSEYLPIQLNTDRKIHSHLYLHVATVSISPNTHLNHLKFNARNLCYNSGIISNKSVSFSG